MNNGEEKEGEIATRELAVRCLLAEYASLRESTNTLTTVQSGVITLNITFVGALLGTGLGLQANSVLLVLPIVSSLLGIFWLVLHVAISKNGHYIRRNIAKRLQDICHDPAIMAFEETLRQDLQTRAKRVVLSRHVVPLLLSSAGGASIFIYSCVMGIALAWLTRSDSWQTGIWVLGIILTIVLFLVSYAAGRYWVEESFLQPRQSHPINGVASRTPEK